MKPAKLALPLTVEDRRHMSRGPTAAIREASGAKIATVETVNVAAGIVQAVNESSRLRAALEKIANPIDALRKEAAAEGKVLVGDMAIRLTENPHYLMGIARDALRLTTGCKLDAAT